MNQLLRVLDMTVYTDEGADMLDDLANMIDKFDKIFSVGQISLMEDLLDGGYVLEMIDLLRAKYNMMKEKA